MALDYDKKNVKDDKDLLKLLFIGLSMVFHYVNGRHCSASNIYVIIVSLCNCNESSLQVAKY